MKFMATMNALDRLRKAANLDPIKKEVTLSDGSLFVMYVTPLTMAERERAQRQVRSDDSNGFALQLLINKYYLFYTTCFQVNFLLEHFVYKFVSCRPGGPQSSEQMNPVYIITVQFINNLDH